jgi:hypothetical protein
MKRAIRYLRFSQTGQSDGLSMIIIGKPCGLELFIAQGA